jgi:hypothetical protein
MSIWLCSDLLPAIDYYIAEYEEGVKQKCAQKQGVADKLLGGGELIGKGGFVNAILILIASNSKSGTYDEFSVSQPTGSTHPA